MLAEELGYEDVDEFEDALKAPFKVFLANLPHVEVRHPRRHFLIPDTSTDHLAISHRFLKDKSPSCSPACSATSSASSPTHPPRSASPSAWSASSPPDPTSGACSCSTPARWPRYPSWSSRSAPTTSEEWTPSTTTSAARYLTWRGTSRCSARTVRRRVGSARASWTCATSFEKCWTWRAARTPSSSPTPAV